MGGEEITKEQGKENISESSNQEKNRDGFCFSQQPNALRREDTSGSSCQIHHTFDAQTPGRVGASALRPGGRVWVPGHVALGQKCICHGTHRAPCPALPSCPPAPARPHLTPRPRGLEPIGEVEEHLFLPPWRAGMGRTGGSWGCSAAGRVLAAR